MSELMRETYAKTARLIADEQPEYRLGGDGSDGTCDCVGLGIGALRRMGIGYDGLHGSNWAARYEAVELWEIRDVRQLRIGDNVLKSREPGEAKWDLPDRYGDDPDRRDYYHMGVVISVDPLRIVHMTSPTAKTDTVLGTWKHAFLWRQLNEQRKEANEMTVLYEAFIATQKDPLNLRATPGGRKIGEMPKGGVAEVLSEGEWAMVRHGDMIGYCDSRYLEKIETVLPGEPGPEGESGELGETGVTLQVVIKDSAGNEFRPVGACTIDVEIVGGWRAAED